MRLDIKIKPISQWVERNIWTSHHVLEPTTVELLNAIDYATSEKFDTITIYLKPEAIGPAFNNNNGMSLFRRIERIINKSADLIPYKEQHLVRLYFLSK